MPFPSSPHWVPTTTVAGTRLSVRLVASDYAPVYALPETGASEPGPGARARSSLRDPGHRRRRAAARPRAGTVSDAGRSPCELAAGAADAPPATADARWSSPVRVRRACSLPAVVSAALSLGRRPDRSTPGRRRPALQRGTRHRAVHLGTTTLGDFTGTITVRRQANGLPQRDTTHLRRRRPDDFACTSAGRLPDDVNAVGQASSTLPADATAPSTCSSSRARSVLRNATLSLIDDGRDSGAVRRAVGRPAAIGYYQVERPPAPSATPATRRLLRRRRRRSRSTSPIVGMAADRRRRRLLAGRLRRRHLQLRRRAASSARPAPSRLNKPIVGMAATRDATAATGWWPPTAASSPTATRTFYGSTGSIHLNKPIVGMAATPDGGRLLAGGLRRGHLHLRRRRLLRLDRVASI